MKARSFLLAIGLLSAFAVGCNVILGLEDRKLYQEPVSDAGPDVTDEAAPDVVEEEAAVVLPPGCDLPAVGDAKARVGNFVTSVQHYDFCLAPTGTDMATAKPLFGSYADCPKGFGFRDVSFFFQEPSGTYDVKMIAFGGTCADQAVASVEQVTFDPNRVTAIYAFGDGTQAAVLKKFQESTPSLATSWFFRFIHAQNGVGPLDFGVALSPTVPTTITPMFLNISYGTTGQPGSGVDANGYRDNQTGGGFLPFGIANAGNADAIDAQGYEFASNRAYTVFGTGSSGAPGFPTGLWVCDEKFPMGNATPAEKALAKCGNGAPANLAVDVYNTQLNGAFSGYEPERRPKVFEEVAALTSDVVCVTEIWSDADKDALIAAAKTNFPHSYYAKHDLDTTIDDAKDQNGVVPPDPTVAPCANSQTKMNALFDCLRDKCSDKPGSPGDESGVPLNGAGACLQKNCIGQVLGLATAKPDAGDPASDLTCWSCAFTLMASYNTVATMRDQCFNNPKARFAFGGSDGVVVLSKHPIDTANAKAWVVGATEWRVSVYKAPITLPNSASVDAYCTVLTTPAADCMTRGYTGNYGGAGKDCKEQWGNELILQTTKLTSFVQKESLDLKRKAVIPGDYYSGFKYQEGNPPLAERYPEAYANLTAKLAVAVPSDFAPTCTYCGDNPIVTPPGTPVNAESTWTSIVFMAGMPVTSVVSAETILKDPSVAVTFSDGGVLNIPASQYYGFRSVIRIFP